MFNRDERKPRMRKTLTPEFIEKNAKDFLREIMQAANSYYKTFGVFPKDQTALETLMLPYENNIKEEHYFEYATTINTGSVRGEITPGYNIQVYYAYLSQKIMATCNEDLKMDRVTNDVGNFHLQKIIDNERMLAEKKVKVVSDTTKYVNTQVFLTQNGEMSGDNPNDKIIRSYCMFAEDGTKIIVVEKPKNMLD